MDQLHSSITADALTLRLLHAARPCIARSCEEASFPVHTQGRRHEKVTELISKPPSLLACPCILRFESNTFLSANSIPTCKLEIAYCTLDKPSTDQHSRQGNDRGKSHPAVQNREQETVRNIIPFSLHISIQRIYKRLIISHAESLLAQHRWPLPIAILSPRRRNGRSRHANDNRKMHSAQARLGERE